MTRIAVMPIAARARASKALITVTAARRWVTDSTGAIVEKPQGVRIGPGCEHAVWTEYRVVQLVLGPGVSAASMPSPGAAFVFAEWTRGHMTIDDDYLAVEPTEERLFFAADATQAAVPECGVDAVVWRLTSPQQATAITAVCDLDEARAVLGTEA